MSHDHPKLLHHSGRPADMKTYRATDEVDFVIVGSGAAGGVMARELSRNGFSVVVLEMGPWLNENDFHHDEFFEATHPEKSLTNRFELQPQTIRQKESDTARRGQWAQYGRIVGGGSVHFTANFWRFPELEFEQASRFGVPDGSNVADWPIKYADLEPYYSKVEWDVGVSGLAGNPFEPPRSRPFPMPPLPIKSEGVLFEKAARAVGYHPWPAPMAINSVFYRGRGACAACGYCIAAGCEVRAKSSSLATMIPEAVATKKCEVRTECYVRRVVMNDKGRTTGVVYFDKDKKEVFQAAKAVILSANGAETPKLLLVSANNQFPNGLANSSGQVGRNIMFNGAGLVFALMPHEVNAWKGAVVSRVAWDTYELPKSLGLYGGGGFDFRNPISPLGATNTVEGEPTWGSAWKKRVPDYFNKSLSAYGHTSSLPVETNRVDLDPTLKDAWGLPAMRLTLQGHPEDVKLAKWFEAKAKEMLEAAGAEKFTGSFSNPGTGGPHLLGTCRMGNDPKKSVINTDHRTHDIPNLFLVDGSSFVTSGRGQPTMTIQALAFRAADRITQLAKKHQI